MKICIVGMGYIGLPTAALLAESGHSVLGVDINSRLLENIRKNGGPEEEPGLSDIVLEVMENRTLELSSTPGEADVFILCLPTPITPEHGADLSFVKSGVESILPFVKKGNLIILESTVPPGTTKDVVGGILRESGFDPVADLDVVFAPERVIPGKIVEELRGLDRVLGGLSTKAGERARDVYRSFVKGDILLTDATTAEFVKLIENSYRDVNIAFANELALLAHHYGINVWEAIDIADRHPRVNIHRPGPGVGGHCIAVDPYFLISDAPDITRLLKVARMVNSGMPCTVVELAEIAMGDLVSKRVAVLGTAYKGNVGDSRESPSFDIMRLLEEKGASCRAHDPFIPQDTLSLEEALKDADLVIVATDHNCFRDLDPVNLGELVTSKRLLDTRNIIPRKIWEEAGWQVFLLGVD